MKSASNTRLKRELNEEIKNTPEDLLPSLLQVVRHFRQGLGLKSPQESLIQGLKEYQAGQTRPISELWDGIKDEEAPA